MSRVPIEFRTIFCSLYSGRSDASTIVIASQEVLLPLWTEHVSTAPQPPELPDVDFDNELVLATFLGRFSTAGYVIKVARMDRVKDRHGLRAVARIHFHVPSPWSMTRQELTSPNHWVVFPKLKDQQRILPVHTVYQHKFFM